MHRFKIVHGNLHWKIDNTHSAPTGAEINVDGVVYTKQQLTKALLTKASLKPIKGIDQRPSGKWRVRITCGGRRRTIGEYQCFTDAMNAREIHHAA